MADDMTAAYTKLTQTPLAKTTTCFGLSAATWTIIVGVLSIFFNVLPGFIFAAKVSAEWDNRDEIEFFKKSPQPQKYVCIGMLVIFSLIQLVGAIMVIVGGVRRNPRFLYCWYVGFFCVLMFARFASGGILMVSNLRGLAIFMFLYAVIDVVVVGLMVTSIIRLTGDFRNEKYLKVNRKVIYEPNQTPAQVNLLPAGSYPVQPQHV